MGLILDSSILVTAERQGQNAQMLSDVSAKVGETDVALSVITLIELSHGAPAPIHPSGRRRGNSSSGNC